MGLTQLLQRWLPRLLVLGALGVVLALFFSNHSDEYGRVDLARGGVVTLPEGKVQVFVDDGAEDEHHLTAPVSFAGNPVGGGAALSADPTSSDGTAEQLTTRSEAIGSGGAVATLDVPAAGEYQVVGAGGGVDGVWLTFGETSFSAVGQKWKLWGGLLAAALLIALIPTRRGGHRREEPVSEDTPVTNTLQPRPLTPYRG